MVQEKQLFEELLKLIHLAESAMLVRFRDVEVYTVSLWVDVAARKSALSIDTFENSKAKCMAANEAMRNIREQMIALGRSKSLALCPPDMVRNENPADFAYPKLSMVENLSIINFTTADWGAIDIALRQAQSVAGEEFKLLKLHPLAEIGINDRSSWYKSAIAINTHIDRIDL